MPRIESSETESFQPWQPDPKAIATLRMRVFLSGVTSALLTAIPMVVLMAYLVLETFQGFKALRADLAPGEAMDAVAFLKSRPNLIVSAGGIALFGVFAGVAGLWVLKKTVGPERRPPTKLLWVLTCLPLGCCAVAALSTAIATPLAGLMTICLGIGWSGWLVPVQLTILAIGMLTIAKNGARESLAFVETDELPAKAIDYFDDVEPALLELGMQRLGDLAYPPTKGKCRRLWANPSHTVFASSTYFPTNNGAICAVTAYSLTESGKWFETASLKTPFKAPEGYERQFNIVPDASPEVVVRLQFETIQRHLREEGDRPMQISREEQGRMSSYGSAYLMRAKREKTGTDFLWLADQFLGLPIPPVPGSPWAPQEEQPLEQLESASC